MSKQKPDPKKVYREAVKDSFAKRESGAAHDKGVAERLAKAKADEAKNN